MSEDNSTPSDGSEAHEVTPSGAAASPAPGTPGPPGTAAEGYLPSGARIDTASIASGTTPDHASLAKKTVTRRGLLTGVGIGAAVVVAGGFGGWAFLRSNNSTGGGRYKVTQSWADRELPITAPSGACDAPLIIAHEKGYFKDAGLNVVLKQTGTDEDTTASVGSGKYIASNGIFFNYLGPIYNGTPVKLTGGLHHGCLDLYIRNDGSIKKLADLKGKKIGVTSLAGSETNFFSLDLLDAGIDSSPAAHQVTWVVYDQTMLPQALKSGQVDAIATAGGFLPIIQATQEGWAKEIANNDFMSMNGQYPCCAVVLNNSFSSQDPVTAAKLVDAWAKGSRWAGKNLEETAEIEADGNYVGGTADEILTVLKTFTFDPSSKNLKTVLLPGIKQFTKTGFIPANTNADQLADKAFVDLPINF